MLLAVQYHVFNFTLTTLDLLAELCGFEAPSELQIPSTPTSWYCCRPNGYLEALAALDRCSSWS